jgi:hypothetical protein
MKYLMCVTHDNGQTTHDYTEVTQDEEDRISRLYSSKKLPATFTFKQKQIVTNTILGFTDKPLPAYPPKFKTWDEFRSWAHQQKWYRGSLSPRTQ